MPDLKDEEKPAVVKKIAAKKKVVKKKVAKKKVVTKKVARKKAVGRARAPTRKILFSQRERYEMIAKMAYFRAESRGFEPGWEQDDWLESERLVDRMISEA